MCFLFLFLAALAHSALETSEHPGIAEALDCAELATGVENHVPLQPLGGEREDEREEGRTEKESTEDREKDAAATEFSCGTADVTGEAEDKGGGRGVTEGTQLFQSDGLIEEGEGPDVTHPLSPRVPTLSVIERLTELHGSEALSFGSALAAQVAARSHTFTHMQECTYGDSGEEEEEEEVTPQMQEVTPQQEEQR